MMDKQSVHAPSLLKLSRERNLTF